MTESGIAPRIAELERLLIEEREKVRKLTEELSGLRPRPNDPARAALRELLAACITRSAGIPEGPGAHEPYALCIVCAHDGDPDAPSLNHDKEQACGKATAALEAK